MTRRAPGREILHRLVCLGPARTSLRVRITGSILLLSLMGVIGGTVSVLVAARSVLEHQTRGQLEAVADLKQAEVDRWLAGLRDAVTLLAALPDVRSSVSALRLDPFDAAARVALRGELRRLNQSDARMREVFVDLAPEALVVASTDSTREGTYEIQPLYVQQGLAGPFVQEVYPSPWDGRPTITVSAPVRRNDDQVVAVLAAHVEFAVLESILDDATGLSKEASVYLVSGVGDLLSAGSWGREEFRRGVDSHGISEALEGRSGQGSYLDYTGHPVLGAYRWLPERDVALLLEIPESVALAPARRLAGVTLLAGMLLVGALAVFGRVLARQVVEPVESVAEAARRVAAGDFHAKVVVEGEDEAAVLGRSFNLMTVELDAAYRELSDQVAATRDALDRVEEGRARLQALGDASKGLVVVISDDDRVTMANRRFRVLFAGGGQTEGRTFAGLVPAEVLDACRPAIRRARDEGGEIEVQFTLSRSDESLHYTAVVFPFGDSGTSQDVALIALDRTAGVRAEEERDRLEEQLRQAQKLESLGLLAGGVAHDFNNLLQAIIGHCDLLREDDLPDSAREHMQHVTTAVRRASELTGQLLTYAGRRTLRVECVDVNQVLRDLEQLVRVSLPKSAELVVDLDPGAGWVRADPAQISQVALNLLTNAGDALRDRVGMVEVVTRKTTLGPERAASEPGIEDLPSGTYLDLSVRDGGCGMSQETLSQIFDPYFSTKQPGRGLGLAAVQRIVKDSGGCLRVESAPGQGAHFRVLLPRVEAPVSEVAPAPGHTSDELHGLTVLVVDDEDSVRLFVQRAVERFGGRVISARDGYEALDRFAESPAGIDVAVLDLTMPGLGGAEVMRRIRRQAPALPVVIASGYDASDSLGAEASAPGVRILQKPYRPRELVTVLAELCAQPV